MKVKDLKIGDCFQFIDDGYRDAYMMVSKNEKFLGSPVIFMTGEDSIFNYCDIYFGNGYRITSYLERSVQLIISNCPKCKTEMLFYKKQQYCPKCE